MLESDHTLYADSSGIASVVALHSACLVLAKISKLLKSLGSTHSQVTALYEELRQLPARSTRPSSSSSRPSTPAVEPFCSILASFARIKLASGFDEVCESATDRQELYTHAREDLRARLVLVACLSRRYRQTHGHCPIGRETELCRSYLHFHCRFLSRDLLAANRIW